MMRPIKARSRRRPRMRGLDREEKEGEVRKRESETGKEKRKSAEYSMRRRRKVGRMGLNSVWRKWETVASRLIREWRNGSDDGVAVFDGEPIGGGGKGAEGQLRNSFKKECLI